MMSVDEDATEGTAGLEQSYLLLSHFRESKDADRVRKGRDALAKLSSSDEDRLSSPVAADVKSIGELQRIQGAVLKDMRGLGEEVELITGKDLSNDARQLIESYEAMVNFLQEVCGMLECP